MAQLGTSKYHLSNVIAHEYAPEHGYCREAVTVNITAGADLSVGSVLGTVTATGKYALNDPDASDGTEVASAIVLKDTTVPAATDTTVTVMVRGAAIAKAKGLVFDVDHDATETATAHSELEALGILVR